MNGALKLPLRKSRMLEYRTLLKTRPILSQSPELFRAVGPHRVLQGFASVFAEGKEGAAFIAGSSNSQPPSPSGGQPCWPPDPAHADSDKLFFASQQVDQVGAFISHVWSAARWKKALALCYYMNIESAVVASVASWVLAMAFMVGAFGPTGMGGRAELLKIFVGVPMTVFFGFFFHGHKFRVPIESVWLDKLCIHQTRDDMKKAGVRALPEVVANSRRMLVLWSSTYFERLWCNAEIATFAALNNGAHSIDMLPLWLAPWILATIILDSAAICISSKLFALVPICGDLLAGTRAAQFPGLVTFLSLFSGVGIALTTSYLPLLMIMWHSLRLKLDIHEEMLIQCSEFTLSNAKCAIESDREAICRLIKNLFHDSVNPVKEFDFFVSNHLCMHIAASVGHPSYIPYRQCLLLLLPLSFSSANNVWGCDNMPCEVAAESEIGQRASPLQQMMTNAIAWFLGVFGVYPSVYPVMLSGMATAKARLRHYPCLRVLAEVFVMVGSYTYMGFNEGFAAGVVNAASQQLNVDVWAGAFWLCMALAYVVLLIRWNIYLFRFDQAAFLFPSTGFTPQASTSSC